MFEIAVRSEADRVLSTLTLGFAADPIWRWIYPEPHAFLTHAPRTINLLGGRAFENGSAYRNEDFTAAALWLPPGVLPDEENLVAWVEETVAPNKLSALFAMIEQIDRFHPAEPCWHLAFIATDPAFQGKGLGAALMTETLKKCDEDGRPAYLESTKVANVPFYKRFGFEPVGLIETDHTPPLFPMFRHPAKRQK